MTYNEIARRILEKQGYEEWMGPKAIIAEQKKRQEYLETKEMENKIDTDRRRRKNN